MTKLKIIFFRLIIGIIILILMHEYVSHPHIVKEQHEKYNKSRVDGIIQNIHKDIKGDAVLIVNDTPFSTGINAAVMEEYANIGDSVVKKTRNDTVYLFHRINEDSTVMMKF